MIFTQELSEGDETVKAPRRPAKAWKFCLTSQKLDNLLLSWGGGGGGS